MTGAVKFSKKALQARQAQGGDRFQAVVGEETPPAPSEPTPKPAPVTPDQFIDCITEIWTEARNSLIEIGRYLNRAKTILPHGVFMSMCRERLPFSWEVAHQLRSVAEAIDGGHFSEAELPSAYSVAYQLVTLTPDQMRLARDKGLVRPDIRRVEILAFKRSLRPQSSTPLVNRRKLEEERIRLLERLKEIEDQLRFTPTEEQVAVIDVTPEAVG
jgi:hypothetical protein